MTSRNGKVELPGINAPFVNNASQGNYSHGETHRDTQSQIHGQTFRHWLSLTVTHTHVCVEENQNTRYMRKSRCMYVLWVWHAGYRVRVLLKNYVTNIIPVITPLSSFVLKLCIWVCFGYWIATEICEDSLIMVMWLAWIDSQNGNCFCFSRHTPPIMIVIFWFSLISFH